MSNKVDKMRDLRKRAHETLDEFLNVLEEACVFVKDIPAQQPVSMSPYANGRFDLNEAISHASRPSGLRAPLKQERRVTDTDRQIVVECRRRTSAAKWGALRKRLQANLKLTRQQVAGILAASARTVAP